MVPAYIAPSPEATISDWNAAVSWLEIVDTNLDAPPDVIEVAEGIPFIELTGWRHDRLYSLKEEIVIWGVDAVTSLSMPVFPKRRYQHKEG